MSILNSIVRSDTFLLKTINSSLKCRFFDITLPIITCLSSKSFLTLIGLFFLLSSNPLMHLLGIKYTMAIIFSTTLTQIIKRTVNRCRPFLTVKNLSIKKIGIDKYSFPSGHTVSAFTLGAMISLFYPAVTCICIVIACLVGISRIYLGVHYPSDVLIGAILGSLSSFFMFYLI